MFSHLYTPQTQRIRDILRSGGFGMCLVGGCVRDALLRKECHDIDIATDATPEQAMPLFEAAGVEALPIGITHGTFCVFLDGEKYEITTFKHGGLWMDLLHRDLTINAMALEFDAGKLIDPHGGAEDLKNKVVRFVGSAEERVQEDPLRILRYARFHTQYGGKSPWVGWKIREFNSLLKDASPERIWIEISKSLAHPEAPKIFMRLREMGVLEEIELPTWLAQNHRVGALQKLTSDPVALLAGLVTAEELAELGVRFKWPGKERAKARIIREYIYSDATLPFVKIRVAAHNEPLEWVVLGLRMAGRDDVADKLRKWKRPSFPLSYGELDGVDDETLAVLKCEWADSGFRIGRDGMLKRLGRAA